MNVIDHIHCNKIIKFLTNILAYLHNYLISIFTLFFHIVLDHLIAMLYLQFITVCTSVVLNEFTAVGM